MYLPYKDRLYRLLRRSERYTGTDMVYLAHGGFWLFMGQVSSALAGFLGAILFANLLSQDAYGSYKYALAIAGVLGAFSLSGLRTSITQAAARGYAGNLRASFWLNMRWGMLLALAGLAIAAYYYARGNFFIAAAAALAAFATPLTTSFNLFGSYLNGTREFKRENLYGIGRDWLTLGTLAAALFFTRDILILVAAYLAATLIGAAWYYRKVIRDIPQDASVDEDNLAYGKHLSVMAFMSNLAAQADNIVVFHFLGAAPLAVYAFANAIPNQLVAVWKYLYTLALPRLSVQSEEQAKRSILRRLPPTLVASALSAGAYAVAAPYIFALFFPQYLSSVPVTQVLSLTLITSALGSFTLVYFDAQREVRKKYQMTVIKNIVGVALMISLVTNWGLMGMAWSIVLWGLFTTLLQLLYMRLP